MNSTSKYSNGNRFFFWTDRFVFFSVSHCIYFPNNNEQCSREFIVRYVVFPLSIIPIWKAILVCKYICVHRAYLWVYVDRTVVPSNCYIKGNSSPSVWLECYKNIIRKKSILCVNHLSDSNLPFRDWTSQTFINKWVASSRKIQHKR